MKYIPLNCLALSFFGFQKAHLCFSFFVHRPHIWQCHQDKVSLFSYWSSPRPCEPSSGLSFNKVNLVNPVHASDVDVLRRGSPHTLCLFHLRPEK